MMRPFHPSPAWGGSWMEDRRAPWTACSLLPLSRRQPAGPEPMNRPSPARNSLLLSLLTRHSIAPHAVGDKWADRSGSRPTGHARQVQGGTHQNRKVGFHRRGNRVNGSRSPGPSTSLRPVMGDPMTTSFAGAPGGSALPARSIPAQGTAPGPDPQMNRRLRGAKLRPSSLPPSSSSIATSRDPEPTRSRVASESLCLVRGRGAAPAGHRMRSCEVRLCARGRSSLGRGRSGRRAGLPLWSPRLGRPIGRACAGFGLRAS